MTDEKRATIDGWTVTLNHRDEYVAHHGAETEPTHILDAEDEEEAWRELCALESLTGDDTPTSGLK